jgi:hypothetical protein
MADRSEVERRVLALLREYLDGCDEYYPEGYEVEDFILVHQMRYGLGEGETLKPWDGGPLPGWSLGVSFSSTMRTYAQEESVLAEALQRVRDSRWDLRHAEDDTESEAGATDE